MSASAITTACCACIRARARSASPAFSAMRTAICEPVSSACRAASACASLSFFCSSDAARWRV